MEHNLFHPNFFHQPSYNLWMYEEYILTTPIFPLVNLNDPNVITSYSTHLERKTILPSTSFFNSIISTEYILTEFQSKRNLSNPNPNG